MIVIDTHILVWWVSGSDTLSSAAKKAIKKTLSNGGEVLISSISAWEIAMLVEKGRLVLTWMWRVGWTKCPKLMGFVFYLSITR